MLSFQAPSEVMNAATKAALGALRDLKLLTFRAENSGKAQWQVLFYYLPFQARARL